MINFLCSRGTEENTCWNFNVLICSDSVFTKRTVSFSRRLTLYSNLSNVKHMGDMLLSLLPLCCYHFKPEAQLWSPQNIYSAESFQVLSSSSQTSQWSCSGGREWRDVIVLGTVQLCTHRSVLMPSRACIFNVTVSIGDWIKNNQKVLKLRYDTR